MVNKYINRYHSFCRSLDNLAKSQTADREADFVLEGTVQNFNLTFDIAWKVLKDILTKDLGMVDFSLGSPRGVLQAAFTNGLIDDDTWLKMLKCRNQLAHDYDGNYAKIVFDTINKEYYPLFLKLKHNCERFYIEDSTKKLDRFR